MRSLLSWRGSALLVALAVAAGAACSGSNPNGVLEDGGAPGANPGADAGADGPVGSSGGPGDGGNPSNDSGGPGTDSGGPPPGGGWDGGFTGPITCPGPGNYTKNGVGCGADRWTLKTGTDSAATGISLLPQLRTIPELLAIPGPPAVFPQTTRLAPTEKTVFAVKDVRLEYVRLEGDSDYHLVITELVNPGINRIITEIPYPGDCTTGSTWQCLISHARSNVDAANLGISATGRSLNTVISIIGVGFFDPEHGQNGAAPNAFELHPVLGICFGLGCDPTK